MRRAACAANGEIVMNDAGWRTWRGRPRVLAAALPALFLLAGCGSAPGTDADTESLLQKGVTRTYYIAADRVAWDYAPSGINGITGEPFDEVANVFVENGPDRIGKVYDKAIYREYTDASFTTLKPRPPSERHLGVLGPVVRAVVGDTIKFVFKNKTEHVVSVHPHGVFYDKSSEGAPYDDGTAGAAKSDDGVQPGAVYTYTWGVPERAGPGGMMDGSSVLWMYHSHVDEPSDTNAGLIGPMVVTSKEHARSNATPDDVDRELFTMFTVFDENRSFYLDDNIGTYCGDPASVDPDDEEFQESNLMHSINGRVYGNLDGLTMRVGQRVRWYTFAQGTEVDLHTPHWHGNTVIAMGMRTDVVSLLPMSMMIADMVPDNPGEWLYHCHVNDHIDAGMMSKYTVSP
ncbi:Multicopper oxidase [Minicystis rosea]|nr:Multicopper oxidase [Minicystis rosea]